MTLARVELAVTLAGQGVSIEDAWRRNATWQSDLLRYEDGRILGLHAVRASAGGWQDPGDAGTFTADRRDR